MLEPGAIPKTETTHIEEMNEFGTRMVMHRMEVESVFDADNIFSGAAVARLGSLEKGRRPFITQQYVP